MFTSDISSIIDTIVEAAKSRGLPALSAMSGVSYTSITELRKRGWRPKSIANLDALHRSAIQLLSDEPVAPGAPAGPPASEDA